MYHQEVPKVARPQLKFEVEILINGSLILRVPIPSELEPKVMVALRNSAEKKRLNEGTLEVLLPCMRNASPADKANRIIAFCRWLARRSSVQVSATI